MRLPSLRTCSVSDPLNAASFQLLSCSMQVRTQSTVELLTYVKVWQGHRTACSLHSQVRSRQDHCLLHGDSAHAIRCAAIAGSVPPRRSCGASVNATQYLLKYPGQPCYVCGPSRAVCAALLLCFERVRGQWPESACVLFSALQYIPTCVHAVVQRSLLGPHRHGVLHCMFAHRRSVAALQGSQLWRRQLRLVCAGIGAADDRSGAQAPCRTRSA
jgi:hypothetical protein